MTINVSNLVLKTHEKNSNLCDEQNNLIYVRALQRLNLGMVFCVENFNSLPPPSLHKGKIVFVSILEKIFWSDGAGWRVFSPYPTELWSWGGNNTGRLGHGNTIDRCSPVREFCSATDWCQIGAGWFSSLAIKSNGQLWGWGTNANAQLGDGTVTNRCSPVREFCSATDWCQVSGSCYHTHAINTSGKLWGWGFNGCGVLGDGTVTNRCSPVREFCSATDWCQVSSGPNHNAAIKTSGQLWSWGRNTAGMLGIGISATLARCSPVREFCSATDWCQVSAGTLATSAIKTSGQLWSWGSNGYGRLGDGTTICRCSPVREFCSATDWCQISVSNLHSIALKTNGELWAWGRNYNGRLGNGNTIDRCSPVREFCSATDWCLVTTACSSSVAIKTSGQLWSWGSNVSGMLGIGSSITLGRCSPVREFCSSTDWCRVSAGAAHSLAIKLKNIN